MTRGEGAVAEAAVTRRCALLAPSLDERRRRLVAAAEALAWGWGGITRVARATGVSRRTIPAGIAELRAWPSQRPAPGRLRRPGRGAHAGGVHRPHPAGGPGAAGRPGQPRRPGVTVALALYERAQAGRGVAGAGPAGQPSAGRAAAARPGL